LEKGQDFSETDSETNKTLTRKRQPKPIINQDFCLTPVQVPASSFQAKSQVIFENSDDSSDSSKDETSQVDLGQLNHPNTSLFDDGKSKQLQ
jgi:hypothetical protein